MYERHFGFLHRPFAMTPDPSFLYRGKIHREALAGLMYGVRELRGLVSLIGEVGTGKSTLLRALMESLVPSQKTIFLTHTTVNRKQALAMMLSELDLDAEGDRAELVQRLHRFCLREVQSGNPPPLLIVDEAQNLSCQVLEEIRLLTNLETVHSKLLQVILSGQPELEDKIFLPELRQLRQRIAVRTRLAPLEISETPTYIEHRLTVAGYSREPLFSSFALEVIWRASGGIPRIINLICDHSLLNAFGMGRQSVPDQSVLESLRDLGLAIRGTSGRHKPEFDGSDADRLGPRSGDTAIEGPEAKSTPTTDGAAPVQAPERYSAENWKDGMKARWEAKLLLIAS